VILYPDADGSVLHVDHDRLFRQLPKELDEAAVIDGAGYFQILTLVFIPVALPGIIAATIFAFTVSWAQFLYPLAFTTVRRPAVLPVGIITTLIRATFSPGARSWPGRCSAPPRRSSSTRFSWTTTSPGLTAGATKG
jgi:multiple sugar transport system permease protein